MEWKAKRIAQHRRALRVGLALSFGVHAAALTVVAVPGMGPTEDGGHQPVTIRSDLDAMEVVRLPETPPPDPASIRQTDVEGRSGAVPTGTVQSTSRPSLSEMLADLSPASVSVASPETGRPVITFRKLEPVAQTAAMMEAYYGGGLQDGEEEEGGGWSAFFGGIAAALSGGGHCPTPASAGPLILRSETGR